MKVRVTERERWRQVFHPMVDSQVVAMVRLVEARAKPGAPSRYPMHVA